MCGRRLAEPLNPRAVQGAVPATVRISPTPPQAAGRSARDAARTASAAVGA